MTDLIKQAREQAERRSLSGATRFLLTALTDALEKAQGEIERLHDLLAERNVLLDKYEADHEALTDRAEKAESLARENYCKFVRQKDRAEKAEAEKEALIKHLRLSGWCNGCKHFAGLGGCRLGKMEKCTGANDLYEYQSLLVGGNNDE